MKHRHLFPTDFWEHLFDIPPAASRITNAALDTTHSAPDSPALFRPSRTPSHLEILSLLSSHPPDSITIVSLGPLTNLALAAAADAQTLSRAKEIVTMGGAIHKPGNITPLAEFNIFADSIAAARVFALTSPLPASTMPLRPLSPNHEIHDRPASSNPRANRQDALNIVLFALDITEEHSLLRSAYLRHIDDLRLRGSPLAQWHAAFMESTFRKMEALHRGQDGASTSVVLHG